MKHSGEDLQNIWKGLLSFAVKLDGTFENDVYINSKWLNCVEKCSEFLSELLGRHVNVLMKCSCASACGERVEGERGRGWRDIL